MSSPREDDVAIEAAARAIQQNQYHPKPQNAPWEQLRAVHANLFRAQARAAVDAYNETLAATPRPTPAASDERVEAVITMSNKHPHDEEPVLDAEGRCLVCTRYVLDDDRQRITALCESVGIDAEPDSLSSQWGHDTVQRVQRLIEQLAEAQRELAEVRRDRNRLVAACVAAMLNIGVPGDGYPANVAAAYEILDEALSAAPQEPTEP